MITYLSYNAWLHTWEWNARMGNLDKLIDIYGHSVAVFAFLLTCVFVCMPYTGIFAKTNTKRITALKMVGLGLLAVTPLWLQIFIVGGASASDFWWIPDGRCIGIEYDACFEIARKQLAISLLTIGGSELLGWLLFSIPAYYWFKILKSSLSE